MQISPMNPWLGLYYVVTGRNARGDLINAGPDASAQRRDQALHGDQRLVPARGGPARHDRARQVRRPRRALGQLLRRESRVGRRDQEDPLGADHRRRQDCPRRPGEALDQQRTSTSTRSWSGPALHALQYARRDRRDVGQEPSSASGATASTGLTTKQLASAYPYKTAEQHYDALLANARAHGRPDDLRPRHPPPDWDGYYNSRGLQPQQWTFGNNVQAGTLMQMLTHGIPAAIHADALSRRGEQLAAVAVVHLLSRRHDPLVGAGHSRHPGHGHAAPGAARVRHRARFLAPDSDRPEARDEDLAVVRRDARTGSSRAARRPPSSTGPTRAAG